MKGEDFNINARKAIEQHLCDSVKYLFDKCSVTISEQFPYMGTKQQIIFIKTFVVFYGDTHLTPHNLDTNHTFVVLNSLTVVDI